MVFHNRNIFGIEDSLVCLQLNHTGEKGITTHSWSGKNSFFLEIVLHRYDQVPPTSVRVAK